MPLSVVEALLADQPLNEERWRVDGFSQCLVPAEWGQGPFRQAIRSSAAVDRLSGDVAAHRTACQEFSPGAGMWALAAFADEESRGALGRARSRRRCGLLADSGLGGRAEPRLGPFVSAGVPRGVSCRN